MISIKDKQKTLFKRQNDLRSKPTESELIFKKRLEENNIKFIFQKCFIGQDYYCIVDFYLPKPFKVCIEIDGGYHDEAKQKAKDYYRTKAGAIKAMNAHKAEEKKDFDRMTSREENKLYKLKFGLFEEWSVHRFELIISD